MSIEKFMLPLMFVILCSTAAEDIYHTPSALTLKPNVDLKEDSLFGFSIGYLKDEVPRLIVGAPRADNIGQVHTCTLEEKNSSCLRVKIPKDIKFGTSTEHGVWLGASIATGSSFYVVCAPRCFDVYGSKTESFWTHREGTFGLCLEGRFGEPLQALPRITTTDREARHSKFESVIDGLGWSSSVSRSDILIVGGPPMGTGTVIVYDTPLDHSKPPSLLITDYLAKYNLGYSVTSGNYFSTNLENEWFAVSSTYGFDSAGKIILTQKESTLTLLGGQSNVGAMFGAALCSANLRGDDSAELVVGAPAYTADAHRVDIGAVYVYGSKGKTMEFLNKITGDNAGDYFGHAMTNVGDVDKDGHDDVAIAAPGADGGAGAVYVYSSRALSGRGAPWPLQRLKPPARLRSFGRALVALADYDDNGCKELAVAAPDSNRVLVYRCFTTLAVQLQAQFPNLMALDLNATNFKFNSCLFVDYPPKPIVISAVIKLKVEVFHRAARLAKEFNKNGAYEYYRTLNTNSSSDRTYRDCVTLVVDTDKDGDFSEMLQSKISLIQMEDPRHNTDFNVSRVLVPPQSVQDNWLAARGCKLDGCQSKLDLQLHWNMPDTYVVGSTKEEHMVVHVSNAGDTSYGACVRIRARGVPVWSPTSHCDASANTTGSYTCKMDAPLYRNSTWTMKIVFEMARLSSEDREIQVEASLYEQCSRPDARRQERLKAELTGDAGAVTVAGSVREYILLTDDELQNKNDTRRTQTYEIRNTGVTRWTGLFFTFELERKNYLEYESIKVVTESLEIIECEIPARKVRTDVPTKYVTCPLGELEPKTTNLIHLQMRVLHKELEYNLDRNNMTYIYKLYLPVQNYTRILSVSTMIVMRDERLPWWIILLGVILGLLLIVLLIYVFYTMGFFGRKNKQKLDHLKREFHRRSMIAQSWHRENTDANVEKNNPIHEKEHPKTKSE